jgi:hypothetical protein
VHTSHNSIIISNAILFQYTQITHERGISNIHMLALPPIKALFVQCLYFLCACQPFLKPFVTHLNILAPPLSIASISAAVHANLAYSFPNSLRSKYSPFSGSTGPKDAPVSLPTPTAPWCVRVVFSGPCCCACWRYVAKVFGRECSVEAGCTAGVWSTSVLKLLVLDVVHMGKRWIRSRRTCGSCAFAEEPD